MSLVLEGFIGSWRLWFFLACLFPMCVFSQSGFCRSFGQMKTRATPLTAPTLRPLYFTTVKPT